ncbi:MAG TPA: aminotransferase class I/II-fold pyridoxal phosphate-dependent enzyme [Patescibacteria group bacterium]|nr:aminotransferase class I/II-fold pyridoxal phosphate-dependent enzyme [Patescibacteria group bacterium]
MKAFQLSNRLNQFPEYIFSALNKQVVEVEKKSGRKVLNLGIGSPDFPPSRMYLNKLKEYIDEKGSHLYPGNGAIPELEEGLQHWYNSRFNVTLAQNELYPLLGSRDGVAHLPLALCNRGDEIVVPDPGYPAFTGPALMIGVKPIYYNLVAANNFKINLKELERKITRKTKYMWVNFPSNPTGQVATIEELRTLVAFAKNHNIWLLYDNAYAEITFDGFVAPSILQIEGAKDIAVEIGSFSKTFSFAGFRMGWIVGNSEIIAALAKIKSQMDSGLSLPFQKLGGFALTHPDRAWHAEMIAAYQLRRDIIIKALKTIGLDANKTKGSLYLWVNIPDRFSDSKHYAQTVLREKQILLTSGTAFGKNGTRYVRVSVCANIDSIAEYL